VTADGIVSFCDHLHASAIVGSSVGTHEAFSLPGSLFAIEPVGANVTVLVGIAAQSQEHATHTCGTEPNLAYMCVGSRKGDAYVCVRACVCVHLRTHGCVCISAFER
jgi:hypothetical protein